LEKALSLFADHDLLIRLDPELSHYETLDPPANAPDPKTKYYKVTDVMHALPRGIWDTTISFNAEITNLEKGVLWVIRAMMGFNQTSRWLIEPAEEEDKAKEPGCTLVLIEDVELSGSRLVVGTAKRKCEENWKGVHGRFIDHLKKLEA
jgi:hypothetical protein